MIRSDWLRTSQPKLLSVARGDARGEAGATREAAFRFAFASRLEDEEEMEPRFSVAFRFSDVELLSQSEGVPSETGRFPRAFGGGWSAPRETSVGTTSNPFCQGEA